MLLGRDPNRSNCERTQRKWPRRAVTGPSSQRLIGCACCRPVILDAGNDIDRFVLARLRENGLDPAHEAEKLTLLRRAEFDLKGLPTNAREVRRFVRNTKPDAFAILIEELPASPHCGERWNHRWLDVARYADSTGVDEDHPFGHSWRYQDFAMGPPFRGH